MNSRLTQLDWAVLTIYFLGTMSIDFYATVKPPFEFLHDLKNDPTTAKKRGGRKMEAGES